MCNYMCDILRTVEDRCKLLLSANRSHIGTSAALIGTTTDDLDDFECLK